MRAATLIALGSLVFVAACDRRDRLAAPDSSAVAPTSPNERSAYLSVSELSPARGDTIIVAGSIALGKSIALGSFRVRLGYDDTSFEYLDEVSLPGMMRVVNPQPGEVIVAGATSGASSDGRLFAFRFRVRDPRGLESLSLGVDEMNDGGFVYQASAVTRSSRLVLDRALTRAKGISR
jgi:hypothetical protein